ncbi:MAG: glycosyltransferase family 2 protein [Clostridiaceae bacterium]
MNRSISAVVPVYNSSATIEQLVARLSTVFGRLSADYEIIMVDDGSCDNSFNVMEKVYKSRENIKIIKLDGNYGQQNAIICGFAAVQKDLVVTIDDDLQYPPEEIEKLLEKLEEGYDIVYGIPQIKKHSKVRNLGTRMTDLLFRILYRKPRDIRISSFRILKADIAKKIVLNRESFVYISALTFKITRNIANVPVLHNPREVGKSNYSFYKLLKLYLKIFIYYSESIDLGFLKAGKAQFVVEKKYV